MISDWADIDPAEPGVFRKALGTFPTGVTAVAALVDGVPTGLAANSFTSASLDPPLVALFIARRSATWPLLGNRRRLGISVLAADQARACRALAGDAATRFDAVEWTTSPGGAVFIDGAVLWLDCVPYSTAGAGDHDMVLLEVRAAAVFDARDPLVFHQSAFASITQ